MHDVCSIFLSGCLCQIWSRDVIRKPILWNNYASLQSVSVGKRNCTWRITSAKNLMRTPDVFLSYFVGFQDVKGHSCASPRLTHWTGCQHIRHLSVLNTDGTIKYTLSWTYSVSILLFIIYALTWREWTSADLNGGVVSERFRQHHSNSSAAPLDLVQWTSFWRLWTADFFQQHHVTLQ